MSVVILTESGEGIGFGHLTRMSALADELQRQHIHYTLYLDHVGGGSLAPGVVVEKCSWRHGLPSIDSQVIVVVDSYLASPDIYKKLRDKALGVVAIDDFGRLPYATQVVLNPNPHGPFCAGCECDQFLGGASWVLLRAGIRETASIENVSSEVKRITITVGGSDQREILPKLVKLAASRFDRVDVAAGTNLQALRLSRTYSSPVVHFHGSLDAVEVAELFTASDCVISGCGQTLHELAYLGVPTVGICVGDDQLPNQNFYLKERFLGAKLDWRDNDWPRQLESELVELGDPLIRQERSQRGKSLIDGKGAERFAMYLAEFVRACSEVTQSSSEVTQ